MSFPSVSATFEKLSAGAMGPDSDHHEQQREEEDADFEVAALNPADDPRDEEEEADSQHEQPDEAHLRAQLADGRIFREAELVLRGTGGRTAGARAGGGFRSAGPGRVRARPVSSVRLLLESGTSTPV